MKFHKSVKIELAASTVATRRVITEPYLEIDKHDQGEVATGRLIATNGRILAAVPVEIDEHDVAGHVSGVALKAARKLAGKHSKAVISLKGKAELPNGVTMPRGGACEEHPGTYPNWKQCVPSGDLHTFKISLNVKLLWELTQAIGSEGPVVLSFNPNGLGEEGKKYSDCVLVAMIGPGEPTGGKGVLMPMRMS